MARPAKPPTATRKHRIPVHLTAAEATLLRARAAESHRTVAAYLRDAALGQSPRSKSSALQNDALIRTLADIGVTLRAIQAGDSALGKSSALTSLGATLQAVLQAIRTLGDSSSARPISAATERRLEGTA